MSMKKPEPAAAQVKNDNKEEAKETKEKEKEKTPEELAIEAGAADPEREEDTGDQRLKDALAEQEKSGDISAEGAVALSNLRNKGVRYGKKEAGKESKK